MQQRTAPLSAAEEEFRRMADSIPQIVWITDAEGRTEFFNQQWSVHTGVPFTPSNAAEIAASFVHPDDVAPTIAAWEDARRRGHTFQVEHRIRSAAGEHRWFLVRAEPFRDPATGEVVRWFGTSTDIHAQKEAERALQESEARHRFLLRLNDRLRPLADPAEIQYEAARALGEYLGASRVGYGECQEDGETIVVTRNYTDGVPGIEGRHRYDDCGPQLLRDLRAGRTVVRPDVAADPTLTPAEKGEHAALQLGATVHVPLLNAGRLVAVLFMHHPRARTWSAGEVALLERVAERTWDAVERARAEAALQRSEMRYRALFDSIDEGFCVIRVIFDAAGKAVDYRFLEANPAFERQTGLQDALGRTARELLPGLEEHWFEIYGEVARTGEPIRFESGSAVMRRWFDVFAFRIEEPESRQVALLFTDVSAYKHADEERERLLGAAEAARAEAEAANRAKAEFLAAMSHELRTPLNAIGGYVELLDLGINGPVSPAQRGALARIAANQRHLLGLINDILSFARLEAGRIEFEIEPLRAAEILGGLESMVSPLADAKGIAYLLEPMDPGLHFRADAERVRQILLNLVANAIKFTPEGGWVVLSCEAAGDAVHVRVRDNGPGIAPEEQERIFDPFQQVGRRLNQPKEGVGLGLAISRDLARAMGGDLRVESLPGEGSTFTLRLPR
jgi:PAS domain S-box-containing protein